MHVRVIDAGRHRKWTGYGSLSRSIIRGLRHEGVNVSIGRSNAAWEIAPDQRGEFETLMETDESTPDWDLVVGTPASRPDTRARRSAIYTQNALGALPENWVSALQGYDLVLVPGEFDRAPFSRHLPRVAIAPQIVEEARFRPRERYRAERPQELQLLFVGSFGFRKGTDLLLDVMEAWQLDQPVTLRMLLGVSPKLDLNELLRRARALPKRVTLQASTTRVSPAWMERIYNQSDAVVTLTRGEGWCMPLYEALLCGVPVMAPDSTAMSEWLPRLGANLVPTQVRYLDDPYFETRPGGKAFRDRYGANNFLFEPNTSAASQSLMHMVNNLHEKKTAALGNIEALRLANRPSVIGNAIASQLEGSSF